MHVPSKVLSLDFLVNNEGQPRAELEPGIYDRQLVLSSDI